VSNQEITTGNVALRKANQPVTEVFQDQFDDLPEDNDVMAEDIIAEVAPSANEPRGGLAAAIARSRTVKQQLEKTPRQLAKESPIKKI
jgi:hypothetical protein